MKRMTSYLARRNHPFTLLSAALVASLVLVTSTVVYSLSSADSSPQTSTQTVPDPASNPIIPRQATASPSSLQSEPSNTKSSSIQYKSSTVNGATTADLYVNGHKIPVTEGSAATNDNTTTSNDMSFSITTNADSNKAQSGSSVSSLNISHASDGSSHSYSSTSLSTYSSSSSFQMND